MIREPFPNVSRETNERLDVYEEQLRKWNPSINLVGKATLENVRERHIADSLQVVEFVRPIDTHWVDLGSGGGLPGLIVAACLADSHAAVNVTLVESDQRKAAFLLSAARAMDVKVKVLSKRIEEIPSLGATTISARALASLDVLLGFADRHLGPNGQCIFHKGQNYATELRESLENWRFQSDIQPSQTSPQSILLRIKEIQRV